MSSKLKIVLLFNTKHFPHSQGWLKKLALKTLIIIINIVNNNFIDIVRIDCVRMTLEGTRYIEHVSPSIGYSWIPKLIFNKDWISNYLQSLIKPDFTFYWWGYPMNKSLGFFSCFCWLTVDQQFHNFATGILPHTKKVHYKQMNNLI